MLKFQAFGVVTKKFDSDSENEVVTNVGNENNDDKAGKQSREEKRVSRMGSEEEKGEFYLRYYVGHKGKFGHEFLEFEFRPDGKLRYANNSNYKNDTIIRKEVYLTPAVLRECRRIIAESEVRNPNLSTTPPSCRFSN